MIRTPNSTPPIRRYRAIAAALFSYFRPIVEEPFAEGARTSREPDDARLDHPAIASAKVQSVADVLPADSQSWVSLTEALDVMRLAIEDRTRVVREWRYHQGLSPALPEALARIPEQTLSRQCSGQPGFRVLCEGPRTPLDPTIEDEIYRIGREAVLNAFRHSQARNIEVTLRFRPDSLRVVIRDDGCGITPNLVAGRRDSYRGLALMRDAAERIGARLRLRSAPRRGTELELTVPGVFTIQAASTSLTDGNTRVARS